MVIPPLAGGGSSPTPWRVVASLSPSRVSSSSTGVQHILLLGGKRLSRMLHSFLHSGAGHSIFVWRLSREDLHQALLQTPAELVPSGALSPALQQYQRRVLSDLGLGMRERQGKPTKGTTTFGH